MYISVRYRRQERNIWLPSNHIKPGKKVWENIWGNRKLTNFEKEFKMVHRAVLYVQR
jgi:hypothetical protein